MPAILNGATILIIVLHSYVILTMTFYGKYTDILWVIVALKFSAFWSWIFGLVEVLW